MKTSHTPGPWTVAADMRGLGNVPVAGVETSAGLAIANCGTHGEANASLIAAAPDLLRIAQELAELTPFKAGYSLDHGLAMLEALQEQARAVMGRATVISCSKVRG